MTGSSTFTISTEKEVEKGRAVAAVVFGRHFMVHTKMDEDGKPIPGTEFLGYFFSEKLGRHLRAPIAMTLREFVALREDEVLKNLAPEDQGMDPLPPADHMGPIEYVSAEPVDS